MDNISKLLSTSAYVIPKNQRGYSWTKKEIEDLFVDLDLMGEKSHYLGTLIVSKEENFKTEDDRTPSERFILEDGQQRLTTILLIIDQIEKRLLEIDGKESTESASLKKLVMYKESKLRPRIENENEVLNECLCHLVLGQPVSSPSEKTPAFRYLKDAQKYIKGKVAEFQIKADLLDFRNKVCSQVQLIQVDLATLSIDRYLTFDAINSRGLPLTEFDKIKNFCILVAERQQIEIKANESWFEAVQNLEAFSVGNRSNENSFISELYSIFHGVNVGTAEVHNSFVKEYRVLLEGENQSKKDNLVRFINLWGEYSRSFGFITSSRKKEFYGNFCSEQAGKWLTALDHLGLQTITKKVLTTSFLKVKDKDEFSEVVKACEIYTFRMHGINKYRVDKNSKALLSVASQLLLNSKSGHWVIEKLGELMLENDSTEETFAKLLTGELSYKKWNHLYYFLYEYELQLTSSTSRPLNYENNSDNIEHIMPQRHRDGGWWQSHWRDGLLADKWVHRLGNLTLTNGNSILGRKSIDLKLFDQNAGYYYNHQTNSTNSERTIKEFTDGSIWQRRNILEREVCFLTFAIKRWSMPRAEGKVVINAPVEFSEHIPGFNNPEISLS